MYLFITKNRKFGSNPSLYPHNLRRLDSKLVPCCKTITFFSASLNARSTFNRAGPCQTLTSHVLSDLS